MIKWPERQPEPPPFAKAEGREVRSRRFKFAVAKGGLPMAKRKVTKKDVEFVDDLPLKDGQIDWAVRLEPVYRNPGYWARVNTASSEQAMQQQSNLAGRRITNFPKSDTDDWEFASRGAELFAKYNGIYNRSRKTSGNIRRTQRKR
jgi:hypothetical protein